MITLLMVFSIFEVSAEIAIRGIVEKIDLEKGMVVINGIQYKIQPGETKLISGEHVLNLDSLAQGSGVHFLSDGVFVKEIRLATPHVFKD